MWDSNSLTGDWTQAPYIGSMGSEPMGQQGSPSKRPLELKNIFSTVLLWKPVIQLSGQKFWTKDLFMFNYKPSLGRVIG